MGVCLLFLLLALVAGVLVTCCSPSGVLPLSRLPALLFSGVGVARAAAAESSELSEFSWRERFRLLFLIKKNFFSSWSGATAAGLKCEIRAPTCQPKLVVGNCRLVTWAGGGGPASPYTSTG